MSTQDNGGNMPAFPATEAHGLNSGDSGISVRDYFAAKALAALIGGRAWEDPSTGRTPPDIFERWAAASFQTADAMLSERAKEKGLAQ